MKVLERDVYYSPSFFEEFELVELHDGHKVIAVTKIYLAADDKAWGLPDESPRFGELWKVLERDVEEKLLDASMYLVAPFGKQYNKDTWDAFGRGFAVGNNKSKNKAKNEFPHHCTRCGRESYNGLFEVAHKDETVAMSCPARRK